MKVESRDENGRPAYVFDGFCHRPFKEEMDGWVEEQLTPVEVPSVQVARDILALYNECNALRRELWQAKQELKLWRK